MIMAALPWLKSIVSKGMFANIKRKNWEKKMNIYLPKENLGCLGIRIGKLYFDFYKKPDLGMFINYNGNRYTVAGWKIHPWY